MIMNVDPTTFRRLVLAKRIYLHGCTHASQKDNISKMIAIHNFDNAIEFVLKCLATRYNVVSSTKADFSFKQLWDMINKEIPNDLPLKTEMFNLHDLRNGVQHAGNIPDHASVIMNQGYSEEFFRRVVTTYFHVSYDQLNLAQLIEKKEIRRGILWAEDALESQQYKKCMDNCVTALYTAFRVSRILDEAKALGTYWGLSSEFNKLTDKKSTHIEEKYANTPCYELAKEVGKALRQVGQAAMAMQYLDEYKVDFLKFFRMVRDSDENYSNLSESEKKDRAQRALEFAMNFILKWQEIGLFS